VPAGTRAPYAAHLRVYEPLAAFGPAERSHWTGYAAAATAPARAGAVAAEERQALRSVVGTPPLVAPPRESGEAYLIAQGERVLVCPWQTRLRCWLALEEARTALPAPLVETVFPRAVVDEVVEDSRRWRRAHPEARAAIRTARWCVPVEWFAAVAPEDRRLSLTAPRELVYRTGMAPARSRVARALRTLRRSVSDTVITAAVEDLGRWLESFHPRSVVELDYGGLVRLLQDEELRTDTSPADVAAALAALASGDDAAAAAAYRRLVERWQRVQALEHAN